MNSLLSQRNLIRLRSLIWVVIICATAWLISRFGQSTPPDTLIIRGTTMGSDYGVSIVDDARRQPDTVKLQQDIEARFAEINHWISTYEADSWISQFNAQDSLDWYPAPPEVVKLAETTRKLSELSDGAYDITIGPLVDAWGFGPKKSPEANPSEDQIQTLLDKVGYQKLEIRNDPPALRKKVAGLRIDFSSIGQGYAVDCISELLEKQGYHRFRINLSGEIYAKGKAADDKPWLIRIETPRDDRSDIFASVRLADRAFASSGDYRNFIIGEDGHRYSHTIDPKTGRPLRHSLASASIIIDRCTMADGIATLLMAVGPQRALALADEQKWRVLLIARQGEQLKATASRAWSNDRSLEYGAR